MITSSSTASRPFGELLREWRQRRRRSQTELACNAGVSTKYIGFLESGQTAPSRSLALRLTEYLDLSLRERNQALIAGGFAPAFLERGLDDPALLAVWQTIDAVLAAQPHNPSFAVDRYWGILAANWAGSHLIAGVDPLLLRPPMNLLRLILHPAGLAPRIANLAHWRALAIGRLRRQNENTADPVLTDMLEEIEDYPTAAAPEAAQLNEEAVVPLRLETIDGTLSLFYATTVFYCPVDISVSELAIECFFPADANSAEILRKKFQASAQYAPQSPGRVD